MQFYKGIALGALTITVMLPAQAQVVNPSFESVTGRIPNSWIATGNVGFITNTFGKTPTHGSNAAYLYADNTAAPSVTTGSQVSAATLATAAGTTTAALNAASPSGQSVTAGVAAAGGSVLTQTFAVTAGSALTFDWTFLTTEDIVLNPGTFNDDFAFFAANGAVTTLGDVNSAFHYVPFTGGAVDGSNVESFLYETGDGTGNSATRTSDYNANTGTNFGVNKYQTQTINFVAAGNVILTFGVINANNPGSTGSTPSALLVDNIQFFLPEPGTLSLLALGLGGAAFLRRRRA